PFDATPTPPTGTPVPPPDATTVMPATQPGGGAAVPPGTPPGSPPGMPDPYGRPDGPVDGPPWYKRPGPLFAVLLVLLAFGGVIAWLVVGGDDDEPASPESSRLVIETRDATGAALDRGFLIDVRGPSGSEAAYQWINPESGTPGQITGDGTGSDGKVDFEWQPDDSVADPATWSATVTVVESIPPGWTPPGPLVDCDLQRVDSPDSTVAMSVDVASSDPTADQEVRYTFPNYSFLPGDTVTCQLVSTAPVETTTTSTTTVPETTTTTTLPPETTVAPSTTLPVVTVPPQPEATLWDVIDNSPDLSGLKALIELAGLTDVLSDPNATLTLLAPSNEAIELASAGVGAPDFTNPSVVEAILLTHLDSTQVLPIAELFALPEFVPDNPGPHVIDAEANPPTIGGATVLVGDVEASNGVLHVIDRVLLPQTLPD
ncbi:MAG: fasciclin domain-containing protein, partial [Acidobacteriota bacterium]